MANMSYCRFENTLRDLQDCAEALQAQTEQPDGTVLEDCDDGTDSKLSDEETAARKRLLALCADITEQFGTK